MSLKIEGNDLTDLESACKQMWESLDKWIEASQQYETDKSREQLTEWLLLKYDYEQASRQLAGTISKIVRRHQESDKK